LADSRTASSSGTSSIDIVRSFKRQKHNLNGSHFVHSLGQKPTFRERPLLAAKRPFIRKTAFGPIPRQMVFKQTIEEDIVGSTGVVKGGSAPPLLPRPAHPVFDLASGQPEIAEHAVVQLGELGRSAAGSQFSFDGSFHDRHKRQYSRNEASHDRTRPPPSPHDDAVDFIERYFRVHFHFRFLLSCIAATIDARAR
jgi:hypothetical protein